MHTYRQSHFITKDSMNMWARISYLASPILDYYSLNVWKLRLHHPYFDIDSWVRICCTAVVDKYNKQYKKSNHWKPSTAY